MEYGEKENGFTLKYKTKSREIIQMLLSNDKNQSRKKMSEVFREPLSFKEFMSKISKANTG